MTCRLPHSRATASPSFGGVHGHGCHYGLPSRSGFRRIFLRFPLTDHGVTSAQGNIVSPCETLIYQVQLTDPAGACAFQDGKLFVILPVACSGADTSTCPAATGGTASCFNSQCYYDVTPTTGIPCLGGT